MTKTIKKILISGFEPFDGDPVNPSALLLEWLALQSFNGELRTKLLPVSFTKAFPLLEKTINEFNPGHVILTGFAKNRTELTLERIAINWVDARIPDNDGLQLKSKKIIEQSEDGLFTTVSLDKMLESSLKAGCPTKISSTAGEYVCNHLLYLYLEKFRTIPGTFIHIPGSPHYELFFQGIHSILTEL